MSGNITIRPADFNKDSLAIFEGAKDFIARMDYRDFLPNNDSDLSYAVGFVINLPGAEVLVAEHNGQIVGGVGLLFVPHIWNQSRLVMDELFWWCHPGAPRTTALRLLRSAIGRARERDALVSFKALTSSPEGVDKVYRQMGLRPFETTYVGVP